MYFSFVLMNNRRMLMIVIYATLLLDIMGISLLIPAFPDLQARYGTTPSMITIGLSVYSLFAFLSAPVLGQLSDKYGRKPMLLLCVIGTALSYVVLVLTHSIWLYLIARIINGVTGGNISIIQSILTDVARDDTERTKNLGILGMFFGIGFIVGPVLGSLLMIGGLDVLLRGCVVASLVEVALVMIGMKETNLTPHDIRIRFNPFSIMYRYLMQKELTSYLVSMVVFGTGGFVFVSTYTLYVSGVLGVGSQISGLLLGLIGVIGAFNQGYLLGKFRLPRYSKKQLIRLMHSVSVVAFVVMAFVSHSLVGIIVFYVVWCVQALVGGLSMPVYNSIVLARATSDRKGEINGVLSSFGAISMTVGPLIGGLLMNWGVPVTLGSAALVAVSAGVMWRWGVQE